MFDLTDSSLMMIEPSGPAEPFVHDWLTDLARRIFDECVPGVRYRGFHVCACGASSDNTQWLLPDSGVETNSLLVHYVAEHRSSIPKEELLKLTNVGKKYGRYNVSHGEIKPMKKTMNDWAKIIGDWAEEKGWNERDVPFPEFIALCHSELSEALEEFRDGKDAVYYGENMKPEGQIIEIIDVLIRIFHYARKNGWDLDHFIAVKHNYNTTRPYRHGGKKI